MENVADIGLQLLTLLSPVILAGLGWVSSKLAKWIGEKTKNEMVAGMLIRLNETVFTAVKEVQQVYVAAIKEAKKDGKLTDEEKAHAKQVALDKIKEYWGKKGLAQAAKVIGLDESGIVKMIEGKIESAVHDVKATANPQ
jgi:hypothetical protein